MSKIAQKNNDYDKVVANKTLLGRSSDIKSSHLPKNWDNLPFHGDIAMQNCSAVRMVIRSLCEI